jgi:hypothetical protein
MNLSNINKIYEIRGYSHLTNNINGLTIPFDKKWKKIAISISGGADSALLGFLICQLAVDTEIHVISHTRCWKTKPWQSHDSLNVFNYLSNVFKNLKFYRHENFIPPALEWGDTGATIKDEYDKLVSGDIIEIQSYAEYVCFHNQIDAYYNAVTRNPTNVDFKGMDKRDIDPNSGNFHLLIMEHQDKTVCHPFRFVDKSWIFDTYNKLNLRNLLNLTRSCEGIFEEINYMNYKIGQYVPLCGECFWCKERAWADAASK